ncbi:MAG: DUF2971 domain-containing protein [Gemmatimonadetes bacterium]|nr:DUF2971 domain-containing protein [Gemmatimonadota bacterium]
MSIGDNWESAIEPIREIAAKQIATYGVVSFSETPLSTLMWAHYADAGRGFVVGFDGSNAAFRDRRAAHPCGRLTRVRYRDRLLPLTLDKLADEASRQDVLMRLLLQKQSFWRYEREVRFILPRSAADASEEIEGRQLSFKSLPTSAISDIVVGPAVSQDDAQWARRLRGRLGATRWHQLRTSYVAQRPYLAPFEAAS